MYSYDDSDDRLSILQMNSELQHAHQELLSAHCATHHLRLQYSADDLVRFGRRQVLLRSAQAASELKEFYSALEKQILPGPRDLVTSIKLSEDQIATAIECVSSYLRGERERHWPAAAPLAQQHKARMWPYFSPILLDQVRIVELRGSRLPPPPFYAKARALGFENLPEITHMDSLSFLDVVVFNEKLTERALFHSLVHAVQFRVLGVERYTRLFVQGFLRTKAHFTVPLEAHAFSLESKFMHPSPEKFSVEDHVVRWMVDGRY